MSRKLWLGRLGWLEAAWGSSLHQSGGRLAPNSHVSTDLVPIDASLKDAMALHIRCHGCLIQRVSLLRVRRRRTLKMLRLCLNKVWQPHTIVCTKIGSHAIRAVSLSKVIGCMQQSYAIYPFFRHPGFISVAASAQVTRRLSPRGRSHASLDKNGEHRAPYTKFAILLP